MRVTLGQYDGTTTMRAMPLAAGLLAASARADPELADAAFALRTARAPLDRAVRDAGRPEVLGLSLYAWNARYALAVAAGVARRRRDVWIVVGGPSIPRRDATIAAFFALHPVVDAIGFGEGEATFRDVLRARRAGADLRDVAGLAVPDREHGSVVHTPARPRLGALGETSSPSLDGTFDPWLAEHGAPPAALLETNRGCPFACSFCDWGQAVRSRVREFPFERVRNELEWIAARGIPYLYLVDANFGIRSRDARIVRSIAELRQRTGFPRHCAFHLTKNAGRRNVDTLAALTEADVGAQIAISSQDDDPAVLAAVRRDNIRFDDATELRRLAHERGVPTFDERILGLPQQTLDGFCDGLARAAVPFPRDAFYVYLARVLEGAEMGDPEYRRRHGLITRACATSDEPVPESEEVVVATATLSVDEWGQAYRFARFFGAAWNLGLLRIVALWVAQTADVRRWTDALLAAADEATPGTVLGEVEAVLAARLDAILVAGRLPPTEAEDDLFRLVVRQRDTFLAEVRSVTAAHLGRDDAELREAFRFQALAAADPARPGSVEESFAFDWPAWLDGLARGKRGSPALRPTRVRTNPTASLVGAVGFDDFVAREIAALRTQAGRRLVYSPSPANSLSGR